MPTNKDPPNPLEPTTVVPANRRAPSLYGGKSTKNGGIWTLKHEISSPNFFEILINTELKGYTALGLKNFYNHINMCLNAVSRLQEDLLTSYQYIKIHSELKNILYHIVTNLPIIGMFGYTLTLDTHC